LGPEANLKEIALAAIRFFSKIVPLAGSLFADLELLSKYRAALRRDKGGPHHLFETSPSYTGQLRTDRVLLDGTGQATLA
jgi:hypothetical protein